MRARTQKNRRRLRTREESREGIYRYMCGEERGTKSVGGDRRGGAYCAMWKMARVRVEVCIHAAHVRGI